MVSCLHNTPYGLITQIYIWLLLQKQNAPQYVFGAIAFVAIMDVILDRLWE